MSNFEFNCLKCGHCCQGKGGIVLSAKDIKALSVFLRQDETDLCARFTTLSNGKRKLIQGEEGYCVFFNKNTGCQVHPAKPDVCKAWPFFRGNLEDPVSLDMAREFCPGIGKCSFEEFFQSGIKWLINSDLINKPGEGKPNALINSHLLSASREQAQ